MFSKKKISLAKTCVLQTDSADIPYTLKRSYRRKYLAVIIDENAQVTLRVPGFVSDAEALKFLRSKQEWILKSIREMNRRASLKKKREYVNGSEFMFMGKEYPLFITKGRAKRTKLEFDGEGFSVRISSLMEAEDVPKEIRRVLEVWYRRQAEEFLGSRVFHFCRLMGIEPRKIAVRTQKRLWGICDYNTQTIHFNWQIILAPADVIDYVVVHELTHLFVPNHSKRFWDRVGKVIPGYEDCKDWLKRRAQDMVLP